MAKRSETKIFPLIGLAAIRCADISQQPLPFNQFGPSSGGEIDTGLRVDTVTGATSWVTSAPTSPGSGLATFTCTEWVRSVGTCAPPSTATSSHTSPVWPGPSTLVGVGLPRVRVQYLRLSPDRVSNLRSPVDTASESSVALPPSTLVNCSS